MDNPLTRASDLCVAALMRPAARYEAATGSSVLRVVAACYVLYAGGALGGEVARIVAATNLDPILGVGCAIDLAWFGFCARAYLDVSSEASREEDAMQSSRPRLSTPTRSRIAADRIRPLALLALVFLVAVGALDLVVRHQIPDLRRILSAIDVASLFLAVHLHCLPPRPPTRRRESAPDAILSPT